MIEAVTVNLNELETHSTDLEIHVRGVDFGAHRPGDFVPVSLISPNGFYMYAAYVRFAVASHESTTSRVVLVPKNWYRRMLSRGEIDWIMVYAKAKEVHVRSAIASEIGVVPSISISRDNALCKSRRRGWVMVNSNHISAPVRYAISPSGRLPYNTVRMSLSMRIVLGLELRSHHSQTAESSVVPVEVRRESVPFAFPFQNQHVRLCSSESWNPGNVLRTSLRLDLALSIRFRLLLRMIAHVLLKVVRFPLRVADSLLAFLVGGPDMLVRTVSGEPATEGLRLVTVSEERLKMLGAESGSLLNLRAAAKRLTVVAVSLGSGRARMEESKERADTRLDRQTTAPVGPLVVPFLMRIGIRERTLLRLPMNSALYVHRTPRHVLSKGFFRLALPLLALAIATFELPYKDGIFTIYGMEIPFIYLFLAAVGGMFVGIISLRVPRG